MKIERSEVPFHSHPDWQKLKNPKGTRADGHSPMDLVATLQISSHG